MANDELMRLVARVQNLSVREDTDGGTFCAQHEQRKIIAELRDIAQRAPQHGAVPDYVDIANRVQAATGRGLYPETVRLVLEAAGVTEKAAAPAPEAEKAKGDGVERDIGGRIVREAWVRWALTQPNPKPSWLVPYDELSEPDKEADRQIFEACAAVAPPAAGYHEAKENPQHCPRCKFTMSGLGWCVNCKWTPPAGQPEGIDIEELAKWCDDQSEDPDNAEGAVTLLVIAQTLRRLASAQRADSSRLDFIERTFSGMTNRERYLPVQMIWGKGANGRTLREACDKYMSREVEKDHAQRAEKDGA